MSTIDELRDEKVRRRAIKSAKSALREGRWAEAIELLDGNLVGSADDVDALVILAEVRQEQGDLPAAVELLQRAIALQPTSAPLHNLMAGLLRVQAVMFAEQAAKLESGDRRYLKGLGAALLDAGETARALAAFESAATIDGRPGTSRDARALERLSGLDTGKRVRPAVWPNKRRVWGELDAVLRRYVLEDTASEPGLLTRSTRVVTIGSCFAEHVAADLATFGVPVTYQRLLENNNSTYAARLLVDWVADGRSSATLAIDEELSAGERASLRAAFEACDVFIVSMGVAPAFFSRGTGEFVLYPSSHSERAIVPGVCDFRTTTPEENAANLRGMITRLRSLAPQARIVVTVSPVPLEATFERKSAVIADCLSKTSLRWAAELVMKDRLEGVSYWPSFEMVKWLGPHMGAAEPFGQDDFETRHVSAWLRQAVTGLFVEWYGDETLRAELTRRLTPLPG